MQDLEGHAVAMAWHWEADDINADEDNEKQWVLVTPQMMRHIDTPRDIQIEFPRLPAMPSHQMWVYMFQLS